MTRETNVDWEDSAPSNRTYIYIDFIVVSRSRSVCPTAFGEHQGMRLASEMQSMSSDVCLVLHTIRIYLNRRRGVTRFYRRRNHMATGESNAWTNKESRSFSSVSHRNA